MLRRLLCYMQRKPIQDRPPRKQRLRLSSTRVPSVLLRLNTRLLCSMQRKPIQDRFPRAKKNAKIIAANTFCCSPFCSMPRRGTRRVRGPGDMCAWCKHMGAGPNVCTWKSFGKQNKFVSGADVAAACFGHMVASVWDGSNVRRQNKDRLKQCLALSVSEVGNCADAPPQHAWAASLLDACELHELRARRSRAPTGGSSCSGSSEDDENH